MASDWATDTAAPLGTTPKIAVVSIIEDQNCIKVGQDQDI